MKVKSPPRMGSFVIELDKAKAPISVENFVKYVDPATTTARSSTA